MQDAVQKPFELKKRVGRARLMALLSRIMIRASKDDLITIPPCYSKVRPSLEVCFFHPVWPTPLWRAKLRIVDTRCVFSRQQLASDPL